MANEHHNHSHENHNHGTAVVLTNVSRAFIVGII